MTASVFAGGVSPWAGLQQQAPKPEPKPKAMKKPAPTPQPKAPPPALAPIKRKTRTDTNGSRVDPEELVIANDPLPGARLVTNKYWPVFSKMKVGQNIRCAPGDVQAIGQALRKYIQTHNIKHGGVLCRSLTQTNNPDGIGRVWLAEGERKSA